ncbi:ACT domain-containing protein [Phyllosticta citrichinensis]|uniref:ACT domain-containing protein n=1 Tax=Phyllosticta citrichinensis TaxID=1130410 RepID=A0ABR1Y0C0_9PEZI
MATALQHLVRSLSPLLDPLSYVFLTLPPSTKLPTALDPLMTFREAEGLTVVAERQAALDNGLPYTFPCRRITLDVHSSLEAVGFMAVVASRLKEFGIPVNPVSGYYHDHCFVPEGREDEALAALHELAHQAREGKLFA